MSEKIPLLMKKTYKIKEKEIKIFLFVMFISLAFLSAATQSPSKIKGHTNFESLAKVIGRSSKNRNAAYSFTLNYIQLAKETKNVDELFNGYSYATIFAPDDQKIQYSDSLVDLSVGTKDSRYIGLAYASAANVNFKLYNYRRALDLAIIADDYLKNEKSKDYSYLGKFTIGRLKNKIGDNSEAYEIISEIHQYYLWKKDHKQSTDIRASYMSSLINLVRINAALNSFKENDKLIKEGFDFIQKHRDVAFYTAELTSADAFNDYSSQQYNSCISKLTKSIDLYNDGDNHYYEKFYLGMSNWKLGNLDTSKIFFDEIISDYHRTGRISQEFRPAFEFMIEYNNKNGTREDHLTAVNDLIGYDSKFKDEQKDIAKKMNADYDRKKLLDEKENLERDRLKERVTFVAILILTMVGITSLVLYKRKSAVTSAISSTNDENISSNQTTDFKIKDIIEEIDTKINSNQVAVEIENNQIQKSLIENTFPSHRNEKIVSEIDYSLYHPINKFTVKQIIKNLEEFERRQKFLSADLKLTILAERFHTNDKYLSRVIKIRSGENFNTYINELRFNHLEKMINQNPTVKKLKIKDISERLGFGSPEFFSTAFREKYGITPKVYFDRCKTLHD
jgi:AraC-like DNA-binding protein